MLIFSVNTRIIAIHDIDYCRFLNDYQENIYHITLNVFIILLSITLNANPVSDLNDICIFQYTIDINYRLFDIIASNISIGPLVTIFNFSISRRITNQLFWS